MTRLQFDALGGFIPATDKKLRSWLGTAIPFDALQRYVGLLGNRTYSQAPLLAMVTSLDLDTVELVGVTGQMPPCHA